jgi:hypothetical protein
LIPMLPSQLAGKMSLYYGSHCCCALCQVKEGTGWLITRWLMVSVRGFYMKAKYLTFLNTQKSIQVIYECMHLWFIKYLWLAHFYHLTKSKSTQIHHFTVKAAEMKVSNSFMICVL